MTQSSDTMRWNLHTFAAGSWKWHFAARRLRRQAERTGLFSTVVVHGSSWLRVAHPEISWVADSKENVRGYGFWRWKPHLVLEALQVAATRSEGVIYLDAGCELNIHPAALDRLSDYFHMAAGDHPVAMRLDATLATWCKREVLDYFGIPHQDALSTPMIEAGVLVLAPTSKTLELMRQWRYYANALDGFLFNDDFDPMNQYPQFMDHRHDQAVLSCLMHLAGERGIPSETFFGPLWRPEGDRFPVWAMRNKYPFSRQPGTLGDIWLRRGAKLRDSGRNRR